VHKLGRECASGDLAIKKTEMTAAIDRGAVAALSTFPLDGTEKGIPICDARTLADLRGLEALGERAVFPVAVIRERELMENIETLADYCRARGALFAPHGKTTMSPQLFAAQIDAGCWALTAATPHHLRVYRHFGVSRIFYANQLTEPAAIDWVASELAADEDFDFYCLVDSTAGVERMDSRLAAHGWPIKVLVEIGHDGGRTGCRSFDEALDVARATHESKWLQLVGIECFEGLLREPTLSDTLQRVDDLLARCHQLLDALLARGWLASRPLLSAGGSAFFDRVVVSFSRRTDATTVLRSGCYVTHDGGYYDEMSPLAGRGDGCSPRLRNALEVWGIFQSRPEPTLVIANFGKRDVPIDLGLPTPVKIRRRQGSIEGAPAGSSIVALSDQHAHVQVPPNAEIAVGDLLAATISHPCTLFDKWRVLPIVDADYRIVDTIKTFF
jgi:D-serine dehydratase